MDRSNAYLIDENLIIAAEKGDVESIKKCQTDYIDSLPWHKRKDWSDIDIEDAVPDSKDQGLFWVHGISNVQEARRGLFNKIAKNYYGRLHTDSIIDGINALSKYMLDYKGDVQITFNKIICDKCGKENDAGALMCIRCGKPFDYTIPKTGRTPEENRILEEARISMERKIKQLHAVATGKGNVLTKNIASQNIIKCKYSGQAV